jgi:hypothetical protein
MTDRKIFEIARDIRENWASVNYAAEPYLQAMEAMITIDDHYLLDNGQSVIRYFLANAQTWRGEDARRVKAELKEMLK